MAMSMMMMMMMKQVCLIGMENFRLWGIMLNDRQIKIETESERKTEVAALVTVANDTSDSDKKDDDAKDVNDEDDDDDDDDGDDDVIFLQCEHQLMR